MENGEGFTALPMGWLSIAPLPTKLQMVVLTPMKLNTSSLHPANEIASFSYTAAMRKRFQIALAVLLVAIVGVIAWQVLRERESVYQGKRTKFEVVGALTPKDVTEYNA